MRNLLIKLLIISTTVFMLSVNVFAGTFSCNAKVNKVLLYKNGAVNVLHTGRNNYTVICNLNQEWKGVSITTCALWVGLLQSVKERGTNTTFYYSSSEATSCSDLPIYGNAPSPVYIGET